MYSTIYIHVCLQHGADGGECVLTSMAPLTASHDVEQLG